MTTAHAILLIFGYLVVGACLFWVEAFLRALGGRTMRKTEVFWHYCMAWPVALPLEILMIAAVLIMRIAAAVAVGVATAARNRAPEPPRP